ncbi:MAG: hypothetical protein ACI9KE_006417, partial [Polyangiales bacterium]
MFEISTYLPFQTVVSRAGGGGKAGRACAQPRVCHLRVSVLGRTLSILIPAIVLMTAATYTLAQSVPPRAPLDELDDSQWIRSFAETSGAPLSEAFSGADLETS